MFYKGGNCIKNTYVIPKNYEDNLVTSSGRSMRNVVEAIVFFGIVVLIFVFLPIPIKIKAILITFFGGPAAFFGFMGIHKYPVTEYIYLLIKFKSKPNEYKRVDMFEEKKENLKN